MNHERFMTHFSSLFDLVVSLCAQGKQKDKQLGLSLSFIMSLKCLDKYKITIYDIFIFNFCLACSAL